MVVNVTNSPVSTRKIPPEYYAEFLGGKAMGGRLALEDKLHEIEPLSAGNELYFMVGPVKDTLIPGASKAVIVPVRP